MMAMPSRVHATTQRVGLGLDPSEIFGPIDVEQQGFNRDPPCLDRIGKAIECASPAGGEIINLARKLHRPEPNHRLTISDCGAFTAQLNQQVIGQVGDVYPGAQNMAEAFSARILERSIEPAERSDRAIWTVGYGCKPGFGAPAHDQALRLACQRVCYAVDQSYPGNLCMGLVAAETARLPPCQDGSKNMGHVVLACKAAKDNDDVGRCMIGSALTRISDASMPNFYQA